MRDIKPLLIALLAIGLAGTWAYHLYDKTQYSRLRNTVLVKDSTAIAEAVRDSLSRSFSVIERSLDSKLDSSISVAQGMQQKLKSRLLEINRLKSEINNILNRQSVSRADLNLARTKIEELQSSVNGLQSQNQSMEDEKKQLQAMLGQLTRNADSLQQNMARLSQENAGLMEKISHGAYFIASEIRLVAVSTRSKRDQETTLAAKTDKFIIGFTIQNNINQYDNEQVHIVIIQPDKKVLQNVDWNSNSFQTKTGAQQSYTRVIRFDYDRGERKELSFTIDPDEFQKGQYLLQLWHRGVLIGQSAASLQ